MLLLCYWSNLRQVWKVASYTVDSMQRADPDSEAEIHQYQQTIDHSVIGALQPSLFAVGTYHEFSRGGLFAITHWVCHHEIVFKRITHKFCIFL